MQNNANLYQYEMDQEGQRFGQLRNVTTDGNRLGKTSHNGQHEVQHYNCRAQSGQDILPDLELREWEDYQSLPMSEEERFYNNTVRGLVNNCPSYGRQIVILSGLTNMVLFTLKQTIKNGKMWICGIWWK